MAQNLKTNAIILRRTNYREADRILTVLTPHNGQIAVIAKGVRREQSRLAGGIELFAECELNLVRSSMNIDGMWTLTGSHIVSFYDQIMTDYDRLQFGYEAIKKVADLSNVIDSPELYQIILSVIRLLNNQAIDLRLIKAWFYLRVARLSGSELNLFTDISGMKLVEGASYNFDLANNAFVYSDQGQYQSNTIKLLRLMMANDAALLARLRGLDDKTISDAFYLSQVAAGK